MSRRALIGGLAALAALPLGAPAAAQLGAALGRTGAGESGRRAGVDEALRRTVSLVLRAEARGANPLPDFITDPQQLSEELMALLTPRGRLPADFPAQPVPERIDRRLPHARGATVWIAAGTALVEIDPVRLVVFSVAPDVLPPQL